MLANDSALPGAPAKTWLAASLIGLAFAWPLLWAVAVQGQDILVRSLAGDAYHYLAIARKAHIAQIYTYDGVTVTNGFHPLWQYFLRAMFALFDLQSHEGQAVAAVWASEISATIGVVFASAAIMRMTGRRWLGLLVVPGVFYLVVGVHDRTLSIWTTLDGMESAFSLMFGGFFFFVVSRFVGTGESLRRQLMPLAKALGAVLPWLILTRLDDVFILPAFAVALWFVDDTVGNRLRALAWIAGPTCIAVAAYLVYNRITVGVAMPLSGGTKAGFVGFLTTYLLLAVHLPMTLDLKSWLQHRPADGSTVFSASFRFVEEGYPLMAGIFGAVALRRGGRVFSTRNFVLFAVCIYLVFKCGYNFLNVNPWHQAGWYFIFAILCLTVLASVALQSAWKRLEGVPVALAGTRTLLVALALLAGSQFYAQTVYQSPPSLYAQLWGRHVELRKQLLAHGVHGLINVDDGITAFLLDMPNLHGFAFAIDKEGQQAHRQGRMLTLARSRGIDAIAGFDYMHSDNPPTTDAQIRAYLAGTLANDTLKGEIDDFSYSLAYYDPVLKLPVFAFAPKSR